MECHSEISLEEISALFNYTDKRHKAAIRWCHSNNLEIHKTGKRKFVLANEFYPAYDAYLKNRVTVSKKLVLVESENQKSTTKQNKMETKVELKPKDEITGLFLTCKCKNLYRNQDLITCKCTSFKYKARLHVPGTLKGDVKRTLEALNYNDAVIELAQLKKSLEANSWQKVQLNAVKPAPVPVHKPAIKTSVVASAPTVTATKNGLLFTDAIERYIKHLNDSEEKVRSKENNREAERFLNLAVEALKKKGYVTEILKFEEIDEEMARTIRVYFKNQKNKNGEKWSPSYYNKAIGRMSSFTIYTNRVNRIPGFNLFDETNAPRQQYFTNPEAFPVDEFSQLLKVIKPANGWKVISGHKRQMFRPWLVDAFKLGLYTGGRRDIALGLKWSDVVFNQGKPSHIRCEAKKENMSKGIENKKYKKYFTISLNGELLDFLMKKGLMKNRGKDEYVLAPECSRALVKSICTRAFPHFYSLLKTGRQFNFKHLRKTYITTKTMANVMNFDLETGHAGMRASFLDALFFEGKKTNYLVKNLEASDVFSF